MTDINIKPIQIDVFGASDGEALVYSASNNTLEYRTITGSEANLYNTYTTLTANIYNTYNSLSANTYNTLLEARSNDYSTLLEARSNDYSTFTTLTANIYNTYNSLSANVDSVNSNVDNVTANLYNTYIALNANLDVVSSNAAALDNNAFVNANDYSTYLAAEANIYNTFAYLNANVGGGGDASNAWVNANDYNTYTTLKAQIDLVNANTSTLGNVYSDKFEIDGSTNAFTLSNTISSEEALLVYIDGVLQHSDAYIISGLTLTLANTLPLPIATLGVRSLSALAASGTANLASDYYTLDGSTNVFALSRSVTTANNILVSLSGVVQAPDVHYVVSSNTLTIANSEPLAANVVLEVRHLSIVNQTVGGGTTGGVSYLKTYALG